ncbi:hypothetical protein BaRGS_00002963 [Batillaria attramentaria]|uniref:G-protein coupled receptors family 1 profile domain-containing protein n=1 Tax=Batillaria attramentaria TaxID=370345 RepID=A0ABD0M3D9_9CAEN
MTQNDQVDPTHHHAILPTFVRPWGVRLKEVPLTPKNTIHMGHCQTSRRQLCRLHNASPARKQVLSPLGLSVLLKSPSQDGWASEITNMTSVVGGANDTDYDTWYYELNGCGAQVMFTAPEYQAAIKLQTFLYPFLLLLGTVGNLVSMVILRQLSIHAWSSCLYLSVLCPVDLAVLYIRCGSPWLTIIFGVNPSLKLMNSSDAMCKTMVFVTDLFLQMWPWLMVALAIELMIATRFPLKTYHMCTRERARAIVLLITILLVCLNLHFFWTWSVPTDQGCRYTDEFALEFQNEIWPAITMMVKCVLPLLAAGICFSISVISLIRGGRAAHSSYEPILKKYFLDLQALKQLKHVALILTLLFLIVKTYELGMEVLSLLETRLVFVVPCEEVAQYKASKAIASVVRDAVFYTFASLKFFVYFAFCGRFREMCFAAGQKMLCCRRFRGGPASKSCESQKAKGLPKLTDVEGEDRKAGLSQPAIGGVQEQDVPKRTTKV